MITINARGAKTLADAQPLVYGGKKVYITTEDGMAQLHLGGLIVAKRPLIELNSTKDCQDWAYEVIETDDEIAALSADKVNPTLVYAENVQQIRDNGHSMQAEAVALAARAALPFKIKGRIVGTTDPRHPAQASRTLARQAEVLINWTTQDEIGYIAYVSAGVGDTDGYFTPTTRAHWKLGR